MIEMSHLTWQTLWHSVALYIKQHYKLLVIFTLLNMLLLIVMSEGLGGIGTLWFLLWTAIYYVFSFVMFRCFFERKPYLLTTKFFATLVPASKILFGVMLLLTVLAYLPYLPLLLGSVSEAFKHLVAGFIGDFMGDSNIYNAVISVILLLCSPFIFYRPFMAWVASVIGRSGLFKNVFKHTTGYYCLFLSVLAMFYFVTIGLWWVDYVLSCHGYLFWIFVSPLIVLLDVVLARTYEFLFLD